ncbi:C39 family peptidase [Neobacillus mesonae]|uniref:C39 family peptidase n=1 Tax=Neobacillus mesonae TaxID=1193713 RepID=UPI0037C921C1
MNKRLLVLVLIFSFTFVFLSLSQNYVVNAKAQDTPPTVNEEENVRYTFNHSGEITSAKIYKYGKLVKIQEFYPGTTSEESQKRIKYNFQLNREGYVIKAQNLDKRTQKISRQYEYYPKTIYGSHGRNIKYIFDMNSQGYVTEATKREKGTKRITAWYQYYPKTVYGSHGRNIKYKFDMNSQGYVTKATQREKGTKRITAWYQYYPKTVYGSHGKNINYVFIINSSGYLTKAEKKEKGTKRILAWYQYQPKTVYGRHGSKIISKKLNVPLIEQRPELPTGCEITAVTMMLQYKGARVNKVSLAKQMPRHSSNPNKGYVGNPFTKHGWTIYPPALMNLVKKYAGSSVNLTGKSNATIEKQLFNGKPIVVLVSPMHGFSIHALVLTGYDQNYYYYNDCWTGEKGAKISKKEFNRIWGNQSKRAISY